MCYQTRDVLSCMRRDSGLSIKEMRVDGGAAANDFLLQFQADILGIKVIRSKVIESTSLGAAYLAGLSAGFWKNGGDIRRCWRQDKVFARRMDNKKAQKFCRGWSCAVKRALSR